MSTPKIRTPTAFQCPYCSARDNEVRDSRPSTEGYIRRRRACNSCCTSFSTIEIPLDLWTDEDIEKNLSSAASALNAVVRSFNVLRKAQRLRKKSLLATTTQIKDLPHE